MLKEGYRLITVMLQIRKRFTLDAMVKIKTAVPAKCPNGAYSTCLYRVITGLTPLMISAGIHRKSRPFFRSLELILHCR
jgi:hypothetical protein